MGATSAVALWTDRRDGDLRPRGGAAPPDAQHRPYTPDGPGPPGGWSWLHQVHGAHVVTVRGPGPVAGAAGDGLVGAHPDVRLAVFTADCAPVALASAEGVIGVAHAGWRGLMAGVIGATINAMRAQGAGRIVAGIGPCICARCYEFSAGDLAVVSSALGPAVRSATAGGRPAFDLRAGVHAALDASGVEVVAEVGRCTACSGELYSHRARAEPQRQALVVWRGATVCG